MSIRANNGIVKVKDRDGDEEDGYDETICPLDYQQSNIS
jgi:hypothetical protein